jgi:hypothetical protein
VVLRRLYYMSSSPGSQAFGEAINASSNSPVLSELEQLLLHVLHGSTAGMWHSELRREAVMVTRVTRLIAAAGAAVAAVVVLGACHTIPFRAAATSRAGRTASGGNRTAHTGPKLEAPLRSEHQQHGVTRRGSTAGCQASPGATTLTLTNTLPHAWVPGDGSSDRWPPVRIRVGQELVVTVPPAVPGGIPTAVRQTHPAMLQEICHVIVRGQAVVGPGHRAFPIYGSRAVFLARRPGLDYLTAGILAIPPTPNVVPGAGDVAGWSGSGSVLVSTG